jgi:hypothetical protein
MATIESTVPTQRFGDPTIDSPAVRSQGSAAGPRPVAHWVQMPAADGRSRLTMVWAVPDHIASRAGA